MNVVVYCRYQSMRRLIIMARIDDHEVFAKYIGEKVNDYRLSK